ncbi:lamin tail domain-containing protein [Halomarina litorea]|uniref:lamin tail domain-containing protein n=1 Tax=Halomarina litorea TaxID=2961595 RepID=UPI0020C3A394|nr:lamin tail domain-containing protein [Halomarina sp. BCD28]
MTLKRPDSSTNNRPSSPLYFSEVLPNPQGSDTENLNDETVLIETTTDSPIDLSGYTVTYGNDREYSFPRFLSDITPGTNITIHSGKGNNSKSSSEPPDYDLFVGSKRPLLRNTGMQLVLKSPDGDVIDSIQYPELGPREGYYRPE